MVEKKCDPENVILIQEDGETSIGVGHENRSYLITEGVGLFGLVRRESNFKHKIRLSEGDLLELIAFEICNILNIGKGDLKMKLVELVEDKGVQLPLL